MQIYLTSSELVEKSLTSKNFLIPSIKTLISSHTGPIYLLKNEMQLEKVTTTLIFYFMSHQINPSKGTKDSKLQLQLKSTNEDTTIHYYLVAQSNFEIMIAVWAILIFINDANDQCQSLSWHKKVDKDLCYKTMILRATHLLIKKNYLPLKDTFLTSEMCLLFEIFRVETCRRTIYIIYLFVLHFFHMLLLCMSSLNKYTCTMETYSVTKDISTIEPMKIEYNGLVTIKDKLEKKNICKLWSFHSAISNNFDECKQLENSSKYLSQMKQNLATKFLPILGSDTEKYQEECNMNSTVFTHCSVATSQKNGLVGKGKGTLCCFKNINYIEVVIYLEVGLKILSMQRNFLSNLFAYNVEL